MTSYLTRARWWRGWRQSLRPLRPRTTTTTKARRVENEVKNKRCKISFLDLWKFLGKERGRGKRIVVCVDIDIHSFHTLWSSFWSKIFFVDFRIIFRSSNYLSKTKRKSPKAFLNSKHANTKIVKRFQKYA